MPPRQQVDWDTVDTVRLFRKILRRDEAFSPADAGTAGPLISAEEKPAADENSQISPAPPTENRTAEPNAPVSGTTPAKKKGQPVQEEVAWGSANRRSSPASPEHKVASSSADRTKGNAGSNGNNNGSKGNNNGNNGAKGDKGGSVSVGKISVDGEGRDDEEWRCPICLGQPIAPRVTKCGHGPFCLVCILRHLKGEGSARCPLCFDLMHRREWSLCFCRVFFFIESRSRQTALRFGNGMCCVCVMTLGRFGLAWHGVAWRGVATFASQWQAKELRRGSATRGVILSTMCRRRFRSVGSCNKQAGRVRVAVSS